REYNGSTSKRDGNTTGVSSRGGRGAKTQGFAAFLFVVVHCSCPHILALVVMGNIMARLPHSLDPIFRPRSVAVVGASATPGSVGSILIRNLIENPFGGVVYPVNPKRHAVHGVRCYPDIKALPEVVDLAVIATPAATVPAVIGDCVRLGIRSAVVISAGFSELGP